MCLGGGVHLRTTRTLGLLPTLLPADLAALGHFRPHSVLGVMELIYPPSPAGSTGIMGTPR